MEGCDTCDNWFHPACLKLSKLPSSEVWFFSMCKKTKKPKTKQTKLDECSCSSLTLFTTRFEIIPFKIVYLFFISLHFQYEFNFSRWLNFTGWKLFFPLVKAGIISSLPEFKAKSSWRGNPLSASISSPGIWEQIVVKTDSLTIWISETSPLQHSETKLTAQSGVHDIKTLIVVCFLYWLQHCARESNFLGDSINVSKQPWKFGFKNRWYCLKYLCSVSNSSQELQTKI